MSLNTKLTIHNEKYPISKPYRENKKGDKLKNNDISVTKILKNELPIKPEITKSYSLDQAVEAIKSLEDRTATGKVVIEI